MARTIIETIKLNHRVILRGHLEGKVEIVLTAEEYQHLIEELEALQERRADEREG